MNTTQGMIRAYPKALPPAERTPELVHGWYVRTETTKFKRHFIVTNNANTLFFRDQYFIEIDISTAARGTGKMAKGPDGKLIEIFGSDGDMQGGDRVRIHGHGTAVYRAAWSERDLQWILHDYAKRESLPLYAWNPDELEIIPPAKEVD